MKVLFISHEARRNGAPIALLQELRWLKEKCPDVSADILVLNDGPLVEDFAVWGRVIKGWNPFVSFINRALRILRIGVFLNWYHFLLLEKYNCIYANTVVSLQAGCYLKRRLGVPLILHVHEAECLMHSFKLSPVTISAVDSFITVSNMAADNLVNNYGAPSKAIKIQLPISFWVDKYQRGEVEIEPFQYDNDVFLVGCFVDSGWFKSLELLPIVLRNLFFRYPLINCKIALIGDVDDEVRWRLNFEFKKIGCEDKVLWLGRVKEPLNYHARFDVLLLLSREESFSLVAQESAIMGTPLIGFHATTGIEEWIGDMGGKWCSYGDIDAMADNIYQLYKDRDLRMVMGNMAKTIVLDMCEKGMNMEPVISTIYQYAER